MNDVLTELIELGFFLRHFCIADLIRFNDYHESTLLSRYKTGPCTLPCGTTDFILGYCYRALTTQFAVCEARD